VGGANARANTVMHEVNRCQLGFRVWDLGFRVYILFVGNQGLGFKGFRIEVSGLGFRV
jgi:hypothetical protein